MHAKVETTGRSLPESPAPGATSGPLTPPPLISVEVHQGGHIKIEWLRPFLSPSMVDRVEATFYRLNDRAVVRWADIFRIALASGNPRPFLPVQG